MAGAKTAVDWLAAVAPDLEACRWEWERNPWAWRCCPRAGPGTCSSCRVSSAIPPSTYSPGSSAWPGPVLVDFGDDRMGFFVPPGTAARWLGTGIRTAGTGTWIVVPYPGRSTRGSAGWCRRTAPEP